MQPCEIATEFTICNTFLALFDSEAPLNRGHLCHREWFGLRAAGQRVITSKTSVHPNATTNRRPVPDQT